MKIHENEDGSGFGEVVIGGPGDMANAIYQIVYHGMKRLPTDNAMASAELAGAGGMGAALNLALLVAKKPEEMTPQELYLSIQTEHMVFAGLMVAHQLDGMDVHDKEHMRLKAKFGPAIFGLALAQWQKLYPHLNAEDYFEKPVVDIAKDNLPAMEQDFDVQKIPTGSFIMRNNGSIN